MISAIASLLWAVAMIFREKTHGLGTEMTADAKRTVREAVMLRTATPPTGRIIPGSPAEGTTIAIIEDLNSIQKKTGGPYEG